MDQSAQGTGRSRLGVAVSPALLGILPATPLDRSQPGRWLGRIPCSRSFPHSGPATRRASADPFRALACSLGECMSLVKDPSGFQPLSGRSEARGAGNDDSGMYSRRSPGTQGGKLPREPGDQRLGRREASLRPTRLPATAPPATTLGSISKRVAKQSRGGSDLTMNSHNGLPVAPDGRSRKRHIRLLSKVPL